MTIPLAIGYLAGPRRNPPAAASNALRSESIDDRPPIPRGVVTWDDIELPVGAGDPAAEVPGPAAFLPVDRLEQRPRRRVRIDDAWFAVVVVALLAAVHYPLFEAAGTAVASRMTPAAVTRTADEAPAAPDARRALRAWSSLDGASAGG